MCSAALVLVKTCLKLIIGGQKTAILVNNQRKMPVPILPFPEHP